jgi:hypothetical protein
MIACLSCYLQQTNRFLSGCARGYFLPNFASTCFRCRNVSFRATMISRLPSLRPRAGFIHHWNLTRSAGSLAESMNEVTLALATGIENGERHSLAKAITLVESSNKAHRTQAKYLLEHLAKIGASSKPPGSSSYTLRIGIAGPPGTIAINIATAVKNVINSIDSSYRGWKIHVH